MSKHTFSQWLRKEVTSSKCALLTLYEQRDKLLYIDGPQLEREYMDKIGSYEETIIKEEIECELLQKKQQMIQAAINRREPIDEAAIDAEIEKLRQEMYLEAISMPVPQEFAELSGEQSDELQDLYREIVQEFHPQMHPELNEVHHKLFQKAQDAYRLRDITALRLIHDMLFSTKEDESAFSLMLELMVGINLAEDEEETLKEVNMTDYSMVAKLYSSFIPTVEEASIKEELSRFKSQTDQVMQEMDRMRTTFPYTAAEMLSDPEKIREYREELEHRLFVAKEEILRRTEEIRTMLMKGNAV